MAATQTVPQTVQSRNSDQITAMSGVVTLYGYNSSASVDRGHLVLHDGVGMNRRQGRFPRVRHGLKRLVVIGSTGMVTFEALRWLSVQDVGFLMLDRDGSVLAVSGPVGPSDARLRRAQSLAHHSGVAVQIAARSFLRSSMVKQGSLVIYCETRASLMRLPTFERHSNLPNRLKTFDNSNRRPHKPTGPFGATFRSIFPLPT